jgi:hypothetical protein
MLASARVTLVGQCDEPGHGQLADDAPDPGRGQVLHATEKVSHLRRYARTSKTRWPEPGLRPARPDPGPVMPDDPSDAGQVWCGWSATGLGVSLVKATSCRSLHAICGRRVRRYLTARLAQIIRRMPLKLLMRRLVRESRVISITFAGYVSAWLAPSDSRRCAAML